MAQEAPSAGPHDEWLTQELQRLWPERKGDVPLGALAKALSKHAGSSLREANAAVFDYCRRQGLDVVGPQVKMVRTIMICVLCLVVWMAADTVGKLTEKESWQYAHELGVGILILCGVSLAFIVVGFVQSLRASRR